MKKITILLIVMSFLTACDCLQQVSGTIIDAKTGKPLQGVTVFNKNKEWIRTTTDSAGHFELSTISGGLSCPPMTIITEYEEYDQIEMKIPSGGNKKIPIHQANAATQKILKQLQGLWYHSKDSMASLNIASNLWILNYKGQQSHTNDTFSISISKNVPNSFNKTDNKDYLVLTNKTDTLQYELLGLTDSVFNLLHYPTGRIHLYRK